MFIALFHKRGAELNWFPLSYVLHIYTSVEPNLSHSMFIMLWQMCLATSELTNINSNCNPKIQNGVYQLQTEAPNTTNLSA